MDKNDIRHQIDLSYDELCKYLKEKYGELQENYFIDESYKTVNSTIKRGYLGLEIHHIMEMGTEDKIVANIGDPSQAKFFPFEYQEAKNLCYCNLLEHLLLHVKITCERMRRTGKLVYDGSCLIIARLDDLYESRGTKSKQDSIYFNVIRENYSEYIDICNILSDVAEELNLI